MQVKSNDFRCNICGGKLEFKDKLNGILVCRNCGNETISSFTFKEEKIIPIQQETQVFETISQKDMVAQNKSESINKICRFLKWMVSLFGVIVLLATIGCVIASFSSDSFNMTLKNQMFAMFCAWAVALIAGIIIRINLKFKRILLIIYIFTLVLILTGFWLILDNFVFLA